MPEIPEFKVDYEDMWNTLREVLVTYAEALADPNPVQPVPPITPLGVLHTMGQIHGDHIRENNRSVIDALNDLSQKGKTDG